MRQVFSLLAPLLAVVFVLFAATAEAAAPLVDAAWVRQNGDRPDVIVLDIRNALDGGSQMAFRRGHIPGAVHSDYLKAGWRTTIDGIPGQLPSVGALEALIGGLGIDNDSHVVIVAGGVSALDMASATRVYWTFKVLGHDEVSILDGGYKAYATDPANSLQRGWNDPEPTIFEANLRSEMIAKQEDVAAAIESGKTLMDNRPVDQYLGIKKHPAAKRPGTLPAALNIPESELTTNGGYLAKAERITKILRQKSIDPQAAQITFCNTGHWASLGWFASSEILGNKETKLYDGSMVDWSADSENPVERRSVAIN